MVILSVDPGYDRLGLAVLERQPDGREKLLYSDCFSPPAKKSDSFEKKCLLVGREIERLIGKFSPDLLAIEKLFFNKNQKTAFQVAEVRGVVIYEAMKASVRVVQYSPLQIKVAVTGYGRSDKGQIEVMVKKLVKMTKPDGLKDDEYDAVAVGLTAFAHLKNFKNQPV